jgi:hypothetical protein
VITATKPRAKLLGSTTPRLFTPSLVQGRPGGCGCGCALSRRTSFGFSLVDFIETLVDVKLLPWQRWLAIHAFESASPIDPAMPIERAVKAARFRFRTLLILIARQNGKTTLIELKNLWKMYVLQVPLVIGTAQKLDLAEESWMKAVEIAEGVPELAREIGQVNRTNGKKSLALTNGSRWKIEPATRGGGRGLSGDDVNLDELREHQSWTSWGAVTKTTMARANAQIFAFTNAGDDKSVVLNTVQEQARAAALAILELLDSLGRGVTTEQVQQAAEDQSIDTSVFLAEWSVPDDVKCTCLRSGSHPHKADCQLQDRQLWAQANPSLGYTITEHAIASALATDPEAIFRTEVLCQRVPDLGQAQIDTEQWRRLGDSESRRAPGAEIVISADISPSRDHASIVMYSTREDGKGHTELIEYYSGSQVVLVVQRLAELKERHNPMAFTIDSSGPASSLEVELAKVGIKRAQIYQVDVAGPDGYYVEVDRWDRGGLYIPTSQEVAAGAAQFSDAVRDGEIRHRNQPPYDQAAGAVKPRPRGDGFVWGRRLASVDITPICGGSSARFAHVKLLDKLKPEDDYAVLDSVY